MELEPLDNQYPMRYTVERRVTRAAMPYMTIAATSALLTALIGWPIILLIILAAGGMWLYQRR